MKHLTIVYLIESPQHQKELLAAANILRVSHADSVLELTKAAMLAHAQQEALEGLHRGSALLRERLYQSEKSRKQAQRENEELKDRMARVAMPLNMQIGKLEAEIERLKQVIHGHEIDLIEQSMEIKDLKAATNQED